MEAVRGCGVSEAMSVVNGFLLGWTSAMLFMYGLKKYLDWRDGRGS